MTTDFQESKYENETVFLKSHSANPFDAWADWYGTDSEAVVTFYHIKRLLYDEWNSQCKSYEHPNCNHDDGIEGINERLNCDEKVRITDYSDFDYSEVQKPGIYLDSVQYYEEDKVDESYTIVIPEEFLTPKLCGHWLDKLNHEYNRRFVLALNPMQWLCYLEGGGSIGDTNAVMDDNEIDYEEVWKELKDKDASIPANVVLTLKIPESEKQKWADKFTQLYERDGIHIIHTEKPDQ